jgi:two-component system, NtrC family, response regulator PilR
MRARILLIEANPDVSRTVTAVLEQHHLEVTLAEDARTAVGLLDSKEFDLLIVDVKLDTGRDGLQFLQRLQESALHLLPRTIVISAEPADSVMRELHAIGICDVVPKPVHADEILAAVEECLDRTSSQVN